MDKFEILRGVAAPLPMINVDTDMIIPKQHLKTIRRTGLGAYLFDEMRYDNDGAEKPDFILNHPSFRKAAILITLDNFGCGSSREHAPWALLDFGIRAIIAPSFADIFYNNCFKNGILPVTLSRSEVEILLAEATQTPGTVLTINLLDQVIVGPDGQTLAFTIDPFRKECLVKGLDDIGLSMQKGEAIDRFEKRQREREPWLYRS